MKLKASVAVACFLPGRAKDLSAHLATRQCLKPFSTRHFRSTRQERCHWKEFFDLSQKLRQIALKRQSVYIASHMM